MKMYDISLPITPSMPVWPGDPSVQMERISTIADGENANVTFLHLCAHTGTHIDAPKHFIDSGKTIEQVPLEKLIGEALVLHIAEDIGVISEDVLQSHPQKELLLKAKKVLFRTRNSALWAAFPTTFVEDYVGIDASGAAYLAALDLDLIGVDYLSVAPYKATYETHHILLGKEIVLLEGIDLSEIPQGFYQLFCLPLNISGSDGAPARAILLEP
jgi:arylformamidase